MYSDNLISREVIILNNLKPIRKARGLSQQTIAKMMHIGKSTYSHWENGRNEIDSASLARLSEILDVSIDDILGCSPSISTRKGINIPVLGLVQAGIPIEAIENILDYEEIEPELAKTGEFFALQIKGDSMEPKFSEGDVVIVRRQPDIESGEIAVVLVNGGGNRRLKINN